MRSTSRVRTAGVGADQGDGQHGQQRPSPPASRRPGAPGPRSGRPRGRWRARARPSQRRGEGPGPRDAGTPGRAPSGSPPTRRCRAGTCPAARPGRSAPPRPAAAGVPPPRAGPARTSPRTGCRRPPPANASRTLGQARVPDRLADVGPLRHDRVAHRRDDEHRQRGPGEPGPPAPPCPPAAGALTPASAAATRAPPEQHDTQGGGGAGARRGPGPGSPGWTASCALRSAAAAAPKGLPALSAGGAAALPSGRLPLVVRSASSRSPRRCASPSSAPGRWGPCTRG